MNIITFEERIAYLEVKVCKIEEFISRLKFALEVGQANESTQHTESNKENRDKKPCEGQNNTADYEELPRILTAQNIADYLGISRRIAYELFQTNPAHGGIPNFNIGYSKRVEKADFIRWIEERKKEKAKQTFD